MIARRFLIQGTVQGVGFRYFVIHCAGRLGLKGWTRNLPDGRVEVVAQGDEAAVGRLAADLEEGPPAARVVSVVSSERGVDAGLVDFGVRY